MNYKSESFAIEEYVSDKPQRVTDIIMTKSDHYLAIATFCLLGTTQLLIWNMVINVFSAMERNIWPHNAFSDLLGGAEHAAALLVAFIMIKFDGLHSRLCTFWNVLNVFFYLLFPLVPQLWSGNENIGTAKSLLCVVSVLLGLCAGFMHVYGYAFASILPTNYVAYVSTGNGIAGAFSFLVYLLLSEVFFEKERSSQIKMIWLFFATGAAVSIAQVICFYKLSQKKFFNQCIDFAKQKQKRDTEIALKNWGERRSLLAIVKDCWLQAFNASFTLFVTLLLFPMCGPLHWTASETLRTFYCGVFQILDLFTRYFPALGGWTMLPKKWLILGVLVRPLIVVPLFIVPAWYEHAPFFAAKWWLFIVMALFTVTNGWFVTLGSIYTPECVEHPAEKEIASEVFVISLLSFVTAGVFASKLPVLGLAFPK